MRTILAFETSSPILSVALGTQGGELKEVRSQGLFQHSENLIPLIDRLLKKENLSLGEIDAFAIDRGPGSFTGLRIGFSLLKGFLAIQKRPCFGALSLDMMAAKVPLRDDSRLGVITDARREAIYARFYRSRRGEWMAERKLELLSLPQLKVRIPEGTYLVGDAVERYREALEEAFGKRIHFLSPDFHFPSAATLVQWFQAQDSRLSPLKGPRDFLPLYFRASEAEEKRRRVKIS
jgi:tRNA threonylcarbamoyl adenosine modification protein YeaZ